MKNIILKWIRQRFLNCSILSPISLEEKLNFYADGVCTFKVHENYDVELFSGDSYVGLLKFDIDQMYIRSISWMST